MTATLISLAFGGLYTVVLWWAIPRVAERIDTRKDGRPGFRVTVADTVPLVLHHDTEGFF